MMQFPNQVSHINYAKAALSEYLLKIWLLAIAFLTRYTTDRCWDNSMLLMGLQIMANLAVSQDL